MTQVCEDRDFAEWHQGCPWCAVWVVRVQGSRHQEAVAHARLAINSYVLARYARQPHITLAYRGLMSAPDAAHCAAEFTRSQLLRDVALLRAQAPSPFAVQIEGGSSFTTVPYLAVRSAHDELSHLHTALSLHEAMFAGWQYVPHVTLGHYAQVVPVRQVLQALKQYASTARPLPAVQVEQIWLARYRTDDIAGPLSWEGAFDLRTRIYQPTPEALWPLGTLG